MRTAKWQSRRVGIGLIVAAVLAVAALAATASSQSRGSLLRQLERPTRVAQPVVVAHATAGRALLQAGGLRLDVRMSPNRAGARNRLTVMVQRDGSAVADARVSVSFSMPAMDMWSGLRSDLPPRRAGVYAATEPVLGMPGVWQLRIQVTEPGRTPVAVLVDDQLPA